MGQTKNENVERIEVEVEADPSQLEMIDEDVDENDPLDSCKLN